MDLDAFHATEAERAGELAAAKYDASQDAAR